MLIIKISDRKTLNFTNSHHSTSSSSSIVSAIQNKKSMENDNMRTSVWKNQYKPYTKQNAIN